MGLEPLFNAEKPRVVSAKCGVNSQGKFGRADVAPFRWFDKYLPVSRLTCPGSQWEVMWGRKKLVLHNREQRGALPCEVRAGGL